MKAIGLCLLAILLCAPEASAVEVTISGSGTVLTDEIAGVLPGDPVGFSLDYDTNTPDLAPGDPDFGLYSDETGAFAIVIETPFELFTYSCADVAITVLNDDPETGDSLLFLAGEDVFCIRSTGVEVAVMSLILGDETGRALSSDALPTSLPPLGTFDLDLLTLAGCNTFTGCDVAGFDAWSMLADVETLEVEVEPVPEPDQAVLAVAAFASVGALVAFRRRSC